VALCGTVQNCPEQSDLLMRNPLGLQMRRPLPYWSGGETGRLLIQLIPSGSRDGWNLMGQCNPQLANPTTVLQRGASKAAGKV